VGGYNNNNSYIENVEIVSLDPISSPVPDCLTELNQFPVYSYGSAGALDYSGNGIQSRWIIWCTKSVVSKQEEGSHSFAEDTLVTVLVTCVTNMLPHQMNGSNQET